MSLSISVSMSALCVLCVVTTDLAVEINKVDDVF